MYVYQKVSMSLPHLFHVSFYIIIIIDCKYFISAQPLPLHVIIPLTYIFLDFY
jgi:hypothetical protein